jgi:hypothetical protein
MNDKDIINNIYGHLAGRYITKIRPLTDQEIEMFYWEKGYGEIPFLILLDDGTALIPSSDPEGNSAGHIFIEQTERAMA